MSRGYWPLIVAGCVIALLLTLGAGAFFGALYAPHYGYQAEEAAYRGADPEKTNPNQIDRDRAGLPYFAERIASGRDPEDGSEREKRDLAAQESMSVWAFWMLVVSAVGVIVTVIGTGFLLWQINLTRRAVKETDKATSVMKRQSDIAEASQRPWLVFEIKSLGPIRRYDIGVYTSEFNILIKNKGPMPATLVNAHIGFARAGINADPDEFIEHAQNYSSVVGFALAPSDEMPWKADGFLHGITFSGDHYMPDGAFWIGVAYRGIDGIRDYCTFDLFSFTGNGIWRNDVAYTAIPGHQRLKRIIT